MSLFNFEKSNTPHKGERLGEILKNLNDMPPTSNAEQASQKVTEVFNNVESKYGVTGDRNRMEAYPLDECNKANIGDREVYYRNYDKHTIFYGENGAIEVRELDQENPLNGKILREDPSFPQEKMNLTFEKPGSDGKKVWE